MATIHPTAIVDPTARVCDSVTIGPYCVIGAGVILGEECLLHNNVVMTGPTSIGRGNEFYPFSSIGHRTQDLKYTAEPTFLEIGDHNCFREFVTVNRATTQGSATRIGSHGNFLAYSHIAHDCTVGDHVIFSNNGTLAGHVKIGNHVVIGGLSGIHQFCRVGDHAIIGGCTKIVQDVPPFLIADGNPAEMRGVNVVGLERRGFSGDAIKEMRECYKILYRGKLNTSQAVEVMRKEFPESETIQLFIKFIVSSERGIIR